MHLSTRLDCDLVAVETSDELTLLVELAAPSPTTDVVRPPATLQVVLDRSGSMDGDRLEGAKTALIALVDRLDPTDNFGVVAFDNHVEVVVPAGPLKDKLRVKAAIAAVDARGSTDLSSGYLRGLQEARRVAGPAGATVLIVSDGHANAGVVDPVQLGKVAVEAQQHRITTSTLGFGLGYDEQLLAALARGGAGNELFAEEADTAVALISGEVDGLLSQVAQAASLRVMWTPHVAGIQVLNDLPVVGLDDGAMLELGSFYAGETRKLLVKLQIPGIAALGLAQVATLEFTHVSLPDLVQHVTTVPIHVNVVPGDQAAGRIPDPEVRSEALFQQTQRAKRESSRLLSQGLVDEASKLLYDTSRSLRSDSGALPAPMAAELIQEADVLDAIAGEARVDVQRAAKVSSYDSSSKSRNRGRTTSGNSLVLRLAWGHEDLSDATLWLEHWQVRRVRDVLPADLTAALRAAPDAVRDERVAQAIADALGPDHRLHRFFTAAALHGGFTVGRA
jgi:Ca-activated chloride channel family protein